MSPVEWSNPAPVGLRFLDNADAWAFAEWEKMERPYPWSPQHFLDTIDSPHQKTLVWQEKDGLRGFAVMQIMKEEAYLLNLMVNPTHRREGWGHQLLSRAMRWSRGNGAKRIFLDVDPENKAAFGLYKKLEFEVAARRVNAYPHGEGSALLKKEL